MATILPQKFIAQVISKHEIAKNTVQVRFQMPENQIFNFVPGQFVTIEVGEQLRRSYSIASSPGLTYFELIAGTDFGGPGSLFFQKVQVGDQAKCIGPLGMFTYHQAERPVYFWATGTGIVPFMPMIEQELNQKQSKRKITLCLGFRHEEDVFDQDYFRQLAAKYSNFEFKLYLSRPQDSWSGLRGRITEELKLLATSADLDCYLCGNHEMVTEVQTRLLEMGIPEGQIYFEKY